MRMSAVCCVFVGFILFIYVEIGCEALTTVTPAPTTTTTARTSCPSGTYNLPACTTLCGKCFGGATCDNVNGHCSLCNPGYDFTLDATCNTACQGNTWGQNCTGTCSTNCGSLPCNNVNGHCTCKPGYKPNLCTAPCDPHYYGQNCNSRCGNCFGGSACDRVTGNCPGQCAHGYVPSDRNCSTACQGNTWGQNCTGTCSTNCASLPCNTVNGHCTCKPGYVPPLCTASCADGRWGQNCGKTCSAHCVGICNKVDGTCTCKPGFQNSWCTAKCSPGRYGQDCSQSCGFCHTGTNSCDHVTGNCTRCNDNRQMPLCKDCVAGQWGFTCGQRCGQCGGDGGCDPNNATCLHTPSSPSASSCQDGWRSPTCDVKCEQGTYGANCANKCGHCRDNSPCRHDNGLCEQDCEDGYIGVLCQREEESLVGPIVGSVMGAAILIVLVIIVVAVCYFRRSSKDRPETPKKDFHMDRMDSISGDSQGEGASPARRDSYNVYQNVDTRRTEDGAVHNYERAQFRQRSSHNYASHTPTGDPSPHHHPDQDPVENPYQNTGGPGGNGNSPAHPKKALKPPPLKKFRGGKAEPAAPEATYGNVTAGSPQSPEAAYGNLKGDGGVYGNVS